MKTCQADNCSNPVFSHLYCRKHQYLRVDTCAYVKRKCLKTSVLKPTAKKPTGEKVLFECIWNTRPHKSQLSGKKIPYPRPGNFAHLLPKGKYPELRLVDINIVLLTTYEHFLFDQGTEEQRKKYAEENHCDWGVIEKLKQAVML